MTNVSFEAFPIQEQLMELVTDGRYRYIAFGGGIRGSKTWGMLMVFVVLAKIYPGSRWAIVRKDLERIRKTTLPSFNKLRRLTNGFIGPVNGQTFEATCKNGSVIIFRGENIDRDPELDSFDGYEVNGFGLEEADELAEQTFSKAIERAGAWVIPDVPHQPDPLVLSTFNPNASWPKRVFYDPWEQGTLEAPYAYLPATIEDNLAMTDAYRESLKSLPPEEYEVRVGGDWSKLSGRYYRSLNRKVHVVPRASLPEEWPDWWEYWGGYDWGYDHWAVFGWWAKDPDGVCYLLDSEWMRRQQDDDQAKTIRSVTTERKLPLACLTQVYAGHDCWASVTARSGSGITTAEVFDGYDIQLIRADIDRINGGRAVRRATAVYPVLDAEGQPVIHEGEPRYRTKCYLLDTPANIRCFDQLSAVMPDPNNVNKPDKVDADSYGRGGDDGCLRGDTEVLTDAGPASIRSLVGRTGWCLTPSGMGRYHSVRPTRRNAELITVDTTHGSVTGTPDHRVLTPDGWCALGDLRVGDRWCLARDRERTRAGISGSEILADQGRILPSPGQVLGSEGLRGEYRTDPGWLPSTPQRRQPSEQPPFQPRSGERGGPCWETLDRSQGSEFGHPALCGETSRCAVASESGGEGLAFNGHQADVGESYPNGTSLRMLRQAVPDAAPGEEPVLSPELQAASASERTGGPCAIVRAISSAENEDTFDLTVDGHAFAVAGGLIVHNSDMVRYALATNILEPDDATPSEEVRKQRATLDAASLREAESFDKVIQKVTKGVRW